MYLACVEGFTVREIADIMQIPVGTVLSRLHRGRTQLRSLLADHARENGLVPMGRRAQAENGEDDTATPCRQGAAHPPCLWSYGRGHLSRTLDDGPDPSGAAL